MSKYSAGTIVLYIVVASITASATNGDGSSERPNFVVIVADDMNWNDCGAYGHPSIRTPNIDRLAKEGLRMEYAYLTTSSCSPSRASILTGRYPHNTGAEQLHWPLPKESRTVAAMLGRLGYYTAAAGKWHLGQAVRGQFDRIYEASTLGFVLPTAREGTPAKMIAARPSGCEDWERALDERPRDRPFFLWLAALDPHRQYKDGALSPPHSLEDVVVPPHLPDTPAVREDLRLYYDEIGRLDQYIGKVLDKLERQQVAENTLVLFFSDNGRPFPRDKTTLYDGGIRTPWIVRWPERVQPNTQTTALVSAVDIAPTLMELAQPRGQTYSQPSSFEGKSFTNILSNPSQTHREYAYAEDHWHDYADHGRCVVTTQFKLIRNDYIDLPSTPPADAGRSATWQDMLGLRKRNALTRAQQACFITPRPRWELYDLRRDPAELHNRANDPAYRNISDKLKHALATWSELTSDYLPSRRTPDEFDRVTGEPDHSVRVRPRRSKLEMFGTNGEY